MWQLACVYDMEYVAVVQSPADYYLRVMMREYQFEPASQMISVGEGDTVSVQVTGRRVEYRCAIIRTPFDVFECVYC